jgi:hypothetical protein
VQQRPPGLQCANQREGVLYRDPDPKTLDNLEPPLALAHLSPADGLTRMQHLLAERKTTRSISMRPRQTPRKTHETTERAGPLEEEAPGSRTRRP